MARNHYIRYNIGLEFGLEFTTITTTKQHYYYIKAGSKKSNQQNVGKNKVK